MSSDQYNSCNEGMKEVSKRAPTSKQQTARITLDGEVVKACCFLQVCVSTA